MTPEPPIGEPGHLILVKHALPEIDPERPPTRWHLSSEGMAACVELAGAIAPYGPDRIVTSRTRKAFETGRILAENLSIHVRAVDDLEEQHRDGLGWLSRTVYNDGVRRALECPDELVFGEESVSDALARFTGAIAGELARDVAETVVAVTHGTVMTAFLAPLLREPPFELWKRLALPSFAVLRRPDLSVVKVVESI